MLGFIRSDKGLFREGYSETARSSTDIVREVVVVTGEQSCIYVSAGIKIGDT